MTVGTLERLVRSAGYQLIVIPTRLATAASTADAVKRFIAQGSTDGPFRAVIQLADDLAHSAGALRSALAITPPAPSGDTRYDAFIAGVVETRLSEQGLALPTWVNEAPRLSEPWFVDEWSAEERAQSTINATPPPLRKRGVILDASELVSV